MSFQLCSNSLIGLIPLAVDTEDGLVELMNQFTICILDYFLSNYWNLEHRT